MKKRHIIDVGEFRYLIVENPERTYHLVIIDGEDPEVDETCYLTMTDLLMSIFRRIGDVEDFVEAGLN